MHSLKISLLCVLLVVLLGAVYAQTSNRQFEEVISAIDTTTSVPSVKGIGSAAVNETQTRLAENVENEHGFVLSAIDRATGGFALRENINVKQIKLRNFEDAMKKVKPSVTKSDMDNYVRINGVISNFFSSEKVISFNLEDRTGSVMVVLFNNKEKINKEIKKAEVIGKVSFYNGKLEIIADSITAVY